MWCYNNVERWLVQAPARTADVGFVRTRVSVAGEEKHAESRDTQAFRSY